MIQDTFLACLLCILIFSAGCTALEKTQGTSPQSKVLAGESQSNLHEAPAPAQGFTDSSSGTYRSLDDKQISVESKTLSVSDQKIIKTANLQLEVLTFRKQQMIFPELLNLTAGLFSHHLSMQDRMTNYSGTVTIRIPSAQF